MNALKTIRLFGIFFLAVALFAACGEPEKPTDENPDKPEKPKSAKAGDATVTVWELDDPDKLNPLTSVSASARYIQNNIFSRLLEYDPKTMELDAQTAVDRPVVEKIEDGEYAGGMSLTFEIRPEAKWDNGSPITAYDYIFTIKTIKNPLVSAGHYRPYYEFVHDIKVDPENEKKFTIYSKERYFLAEEAAGDLHLVPEYIYDAEGLMKKFSIDQLNTTSQTELANNADIKRFAEQFNDNKFSREVIVGSGPYKFEKWEPSQSIVLKRKEDWWGDQVDEYLLEAYPPKITFKIINDPTTAVTAAKDEQLDVLRSVKPRNYVDLKEEKKFNEKFELSSPDMFAYYYLGINTKDPKLSDKKVRRAIAHLVKRDDIIDVLFQGMATKTNGPISPRKPYYNNDIESIEYDLDKAKALLQEAGWTDSDQDGILDKVIGGKKTDFALKYKYNQGNEIRKNIGVLLQEEARKAGIKVELEVREWTVFLDEMKRHEFEIVCSAWAQGPGLDDLKQIWHSSSYTPDGSNRVGFGSAASDKIIDQIRVTLDEEKRTELYKEIQSIIHDEQPYVFLCVPGERIVIHRRFKNTETTALRPGYREIGFQLKDQAN